jgi:hypothetical protein
VAIGKTCRLLVDPRGHVADGSIHMRAVLECPHFSSPLVNPVLSYTQSIRAKPHAHIARCFGVIASGDNVYRPVFGLRAGRAQQRDTFDPLGRFADGRSGPRRRTDLRSQDRQDAVLDLRWLPAQGLSRCSICRSPLPSLSKRAEPKAAVTWQDPVGDQAVGPSTTDRCAYPRWRFA